MRSYRVFMAVALCLAISANVLGLPTDSKVAVVKMVRGKAFAIKNGQEKKLAVGQWIEEGTAIRTAAKSFVMLVFTDKSRISVSPQSQTVIEKFNRTDPGVISVLNGKIRSQVTKDYLKRSRKVSKMFVKSKSAAMGVRGTDFIFAYNKENNNSSAILFEGSVTFARIESNQFSDNTGLEKIVSGPGARIVRPGEFSVVNQIASRPTLPAALNIRQKEILEKNKDFSSVEKNSKGVSKSIVPPGLSGKTVSNRPEGMGSTPPQESPINNSNPMNGAYIHLETGTIVAPGNDSANGPETMGSIDSSGEFVPKKGVQITLDGKLIESKRAGESNVPSSGSPSNNDVTNENFAPGGDILDPVTRRERDTNTKDSAAPSILGGPGQVKIKTRSTD